MKQLGLEPMSIRDVSTIGYGLVCCVMTPETTNILVTSKEIALKVNKFFSRRVFELLYASLNEFL